MYSMHCDLWDSKGACVDKICTHPICKNLDASHKKQVELLRRLREMPGVKKSVHRLRDTL